MSRKSKRIKNTFIFGLCPVCREELKEKNAHIFDKKNAVTRYCVKCARCSSSVLLSVSSTDSNVTATLGILTDAQKSDFSLIQDSAQISADDVLEIHKSLENYVQ
ncbi:MAG TPA: hypothetical protein VJK01_00510 [Candidatus Paceibacterota bacterium]